MEKMSTPSLSFTAKTLRSTRTSRCAIVSQVADHLIEIVERGEVTVTSSPGQCPRDRKAGSRPQCADGSENLREPVVVMGEKVTSAFADDPAGRAVCRQHRLVVVVRQQCQRPQEVVQRQIPRAQLEPDRWRDRGQDVVSGEDQPPRTIMKDKVPLGVPGCS